MSNSKELHMCNSNCTCANLGIPVSADSVKNISALRAEMSCFRGLQKTFSALRAEISKPLPGPGIWGEDYAFRSPFKITLFSEAPSRKKNSALRAEISKPLENYP